VRQENEPVGGGEFVIALETDVVQFDPIKIVSATTGQAASQMMENLVMRNTEGEIVPALATGWEPNENGDVWTFKLREDVKFHDGSEFNSEIAKQKGLSRIVC
jgi:peptide/nickel transport system substrate-binding protein